MTRESSRRGHLLCLAVMAVALVLFLGTVGSGFVWDDELLFRSWLPYFDCPRAVLSPPAGIPHFMYQYYRPVLIASYLIDERLAAAVFPAEARDTGRRVFFHLTPVLLHVACTALVFLLGTLLLRGRSQRREDDHAWIAFAGALLFAVHPIHVESVAWIVGRSDSLCTLAGLASLIALLHWREHRRWPSLVGATVLLLLAMLTKEIALGVLLPACVVVLSWPNPERKEETRRMRVYEIVALVALLAVYAGLRMASTSQAHASVSSAGALRRLLGALGWYAVKAVWPFPQTAFPDDQPGFPFVLAGCVAGVLAATAFIVWRGNNWRAERAVLAIAVGGSAVSLLVAVTNVSTSPVAERNLYLPSAGGCLLVVFLTERLVSRYGAATVSRVPAVALLAGVLTIPSSWAISRRVAVWDNPVLFWSEARESAPRSAVARINLGAALLTAGRLGEAEQAYQEAVRLAKVSDQSAMAHANLGSLLLLQGKSDDAIGHFGQALAADPRDATSHFNWASALAMKAEHAVTTERAGLLEEASGHLATALVLHPRYSKAHLLLGTILLGSGQAARARNELEMAAAPDPGSPESTRARALLAGAPIDPSEGRVTRGEVPIQ